MKTVKNDDGLGTARFPEWLAEILASDFPNAESVSGQAVSAWAVSGHFPKFWKVFVKVGSADEPAVSKRSGWTVESVPEFQRPAFAFSAVSLNPLTGEPSDPLDAFSESKSRVIRLLRDGPLSAEDVLEGFMLKAISWFRFDKDAYFSLWKAVRKLDGFEPEKASPYLNAIVDGPHATAALADMFERGFMEGLAPELHVTGSNGGLRQHLEGWVFRHSLLVLANVANNAKLSSLDGNRHLGAKWAALFHDVGLHEAFAVPGGHSAFEKSWKKRLRDHAQASERVFCGFLERGFELPGEAAEFAKALVLHHHIPTELFELRDKASFTFVVTRPFFRDFYEFWRCDQFWSIPPSYQHVEAVERMLAENGFSIPSPEDVPAS